MKIAESKGFRSYNENRGDEGVPFFNVTVGTRVPILSSGNIVDPVRDMTRRCVTIRLDPACETPAAREFHRRPVEDAVAGFGKRTLRNV